MLGRVIIGDIAATLVDLAVRGVLAVEETDEEGQARSMLCGQATGRQVGGAVALRENGCWRR